MKRSDFVTSAVFLLFAVVFYCFVVLLQIPLVMLINYLLTQVDFRPLGAFLFDWGSAITVVVIYGVSVLALSKIVLIRLRGILFYMAIISAVFALGHARTYSSGGSNILEVLIYAAPSIGAWIAWRFRVAN